MWINLLSVNFLVIATLCMNNTWGSIQIMQWCNHGCRKVHLKQYLPGQRYSYEHSQHSLPCFVLTKHFSGFRNGGRQASAQVMLVICVECSFSGISASFVWIWYSYSTFRKLGSLSKGVYRNPVLELDCFHNLFYLWFPSTFISDWYFSIWLYCVVTYAVESIISRLFCQTKYVFCQCVKFMRAFHFEWIQVLYKFLLLF